LNTQYSKQFEKGWDDENNPNWVASAYPVLAFLGLKLTQIGAFLDNLIGGWTFFMQVAQFFPNVPKPTSVKVLSYLRINKVVS